MTRRRPAWRGSEAAPSRKDTAEALRTLRDLARETKTLNARIVDALQTDNGESSLPGNRATRRVKSNRRDGKGRPSTLRADGEVLPNE